MVKYFKLIHYILFLVVGIQTSALAFDCDDISKLDYNNGANGGYIFIFGCGDATYDFVKKNYKQWPESIIKMAGHHYFLEDVGPLKEKNLRDHLVATDDPLSDLLLYIQLSRFLPSIDAFYKRLEQAKLPELLIDELMSSLYFAADFYDSKEGLRNLSEVSSMQTAARSKLPYVKQWLTAARIKDGRLSSPNFESAKFFFSFKEKIPNLHEIMGKLTEDLAEIEISEYNVILNTINHGVENKSPWAFMSLADAFYFGFYDLEIDFSTSLAYFEEPALYGMAYAQYSIGYAYYWGEGVDEDEQYGVDWLNSAAENWDLSAVDELTNYYITQNNYADALRIMLANAEMGYLSFNKLGYQAAYILANDAFDDRGQIKKFREYLLHHCLENPFVKDEDKNDCFMDENQNFKKFATTPNLINALANVGELRYQSDINLNTGKYKALVIGNWDYVNWTKLETPKQDIEDVSTALRGLGFEVEILKNSDRRDVLKAIYESSKNLSFNDHFLIYYAGHGIIDRETDVGYWIPAAASRDFQPDWISSSEILNALKSIPARHVLLVADSCYSGKLLRSGAQSTTNPSNSMIQRLFEKKARVAITSGGEEPVADSIQGSNNSVFASAFLNALSSIETPTPASKLFDEILGSVSINANQTPQYSDMRELGHDGGDFIFVPINN